MAMRVDLGGMKEFSNPLDRWRVNQYHFHLSALLARRILWIPSTSALSERVFSTAGHTITKSQTRYPVPDFGSPSQAGPALLPEFANKAGKAGLQALGLFHTLN